MANVKIQNVEFGQLFNHAGRVYYIPWQSEVITIAGADFVPAKLARDNVRLNPRGRWHNVPYHTMVETLGTSAARAE